MPSPVERARAKVMQASVNEKNRSVAPAAPNFAGMAQVPTVPVVSPDMEFYLRALKEDMSPDAQKELDAAHQNAVVKHAMALAQAGQAPLEHAAQMQFLQQQDQGDQGHGAAMQVLEAQDPAYQQYLQGMSTQRTQEGDARRLAPTVQRSVYDTTRRVMAINQAAQHARGAIVDPLEMLKYLGPNAFMGGVNGTIQRTEK